MIKSTNTINIDGTVLKDEDYIKMFTFSKDDKFSQWILRPLAIIATLGLVLAMFFASAFILVLSLAMIPLFAISFWVVKTKLARDIANNNPVVGTQAKVSDEPTTDTQTTI